MRVEVVTQVVSDNIEDQYRNHNGQAGENDHPGGREEITAVQTYHRPPGGKRRLNTQPQETQGRLGKDKTSDLQTGNNNGQGKTIRKDMQKDDPCWRAADCFGCIHKLGFPQGEDNAADQAGKGCPSNQGQGEEDREDSRRKGHAYPDCQEQAGKGKYQVNEHGDYSIHFPSEITSESPYDYPESYGGKGDSEPDEERIACSKDDPAENISSLAVCPKDMVPGRRESQAVQINLQGVIGGEERGSKGNADQQNDDEKRSHCPGAIFTGVGDFSPIHFLLPHPDPRIQVEVDKVNKKVDEYKKGSTNQNCAHDYRVVPPHDPFHCIPSYPVPSEDRLS